MVVIAIMFILFMLNNVYQALIKTEVFSIELKLDEFLVIRLVKFLC